LINLILCFFIVNYYFQLFLFLINPITGATLMTDPTNTGNDSDSMVIADIHKSTSTLDLSDRLAAVPSIPWFQSTGGLRLLRYPIDLKVLQEAALMNAFHGACMRTLRVAAVGGGYDCDNPAAVVQVLDSGDLVAAVNDRIQFGNAYFEMETDALGGVAALHYMRATSVWRAVDGNYAQMVINPTTNLFTWRSIPADRVIHWRERSHLSDWYGVPGYIPALQQAALSHATDEFHRMFYKNGGMVGLIYLLTGVKNLAQQDKDDLKARIQDTTGDKRFTDMLLAFKETDVQLNLIGGAAEKNPRGDRYDEIKTHTINAILSAHQVPPRLAGIVNGNLAPAPGGMEEEMRYYNLSVVEPFQTEAEAFFNPWLPCPIRFKPYLLSRYGATTSTPNPGAAPEVLQNK